MKDQFVYKKKTLLSLEVWESEGKIGYGFSNILNSIDIATQNILTSYGLTNDANDIISLLLKQFALMSNQNLENTTDKLTKQGFNIYLKSAFDQALKSYDSIKNDLEIHLSKDEFSTEITNSFSQQLEHLDESDFPLVNDPINHPAIKFIKSTISQILKIAKISNSKIDEFLRNFNENIAKTIIDTFGEKAYAKHLENTKEKWIRENEKDFLLYLKGLSKLGFAENENLKFQKAFGFWEDVRNYGSLNDDDDYSHSNNPKYSEKKLIPIEDLIDEYYKSYKTKENFLNNILFLVADFGKGKTSFLRHYASELAANYLKTHEGYFPIYLNLNEYDKFSNSPSLGIIANYLAKEFKIDITENYFKKKKFFFLIDSLDECGELTDNNIEKVIKDVIEIQNLDSINCRDNKIIIASRPIANGLKEQITKYCPFKNKEKDSEYTDNYISVYGFKEEQFDDYIEFAIKKYIDKNNETEENYTGISHEIISNIINRKEINLHKKLLNTVLKSSELRRPIFAYMIYKLIISNSNFIDLGKVGVYISFLNQLTRDAKHIDDVRHKVSLKEELQYRNILHASSLLWQYKRQNGEQTSMTKADICRTIEEKEIDKDDRKVLNEFEGIKSIHFLSHSYLGEKENTLHFQHQSLAEILLAEYYLKVFIKYSIEDNTDIEEARIKLNIGLPTDQTVDFFQGLILLLKECVLGNPKNKEIYAKRELLIPLLASLGIKDYNKKLYSIRLNATWLEKYESKILSAKKIPSEIIYDFPLDASTLKKIETLCINIINSKKTYILDEPKQHSVLFKNELISINNQNKFNIDKWYSLILGNLLKNDIEEKIFFNSDLSSSIIFNLINDWNTHDDYLPYWSENLFMGINMLKNDNRESYHLNLYNVNFSYSYLKKINLRDSNLINCNFSNCTFENIQFYKCDISRSNFDNINIIGKSEDDIHIGGRLNILFCFIAQGILFPEKLNNVLKGNKYGLVNFGSKYTIIGDTHITFVEEEIIPLKGIFKYILLEGNNSDFIISAFKFEKIQGNKKIELEFQKFIQELEIEVNQT